MVIYTAAMALHKGEGLATLIPSNIEHNISEIKQDTEGRYLLIKGTFMVNKLSLLNIYAPTADKILEQSKLLDIITPIIEKNSGSILF
jgi:hypothetical protein